METPIKETLVENEMEFDWQSFLDEAIANAIRNRPNRRGRKPVDKSDMIREAARIVAKIPDNGYFEEKGRQIVIRKEVNNKPIKNVKSLVAALKSNFLNSPYLGDYKPETKPASDKSFAIPDDGKKIKFESIEYALYPQSDCDYPLDLIPVGDNYKNPRICFTKRESVNPWIFVEKFCREN